MNSLDNELANARAIDLGAANTKLTIGINDRRIPVCKSFLSEAYQVQERRTFDQLIEQKKNVTLVTVDGIVYEVGPDASLGNNGYSKIIDTNYCDTAAYKALMLGAMEFLGVSDIPMLALGLPLSTYWNKAKELQERYTGDIETGKGKIRVREVVVLPQPLGGFYNYALTEGKLGKLKGQQTLVVDPGGNTLDWLLLDGELPIEHRSGAAERSGMLDVLKLIRKEIIHGEKIGDFGSLMRLDEAIRAKREFLMVDGVKVPLAKYMGAGEHAIENAIARMYESIGGKGSIETVVLVGGGGELYKDRLVKLFGDRVVLAGTEDSHIFDNVKGFHYVAMQRLRRKAKLTATA